MAQRSPLAAVRLARAHDGLGADPYGARSGFDSFAEAMRRAREEESRQREAKRQRDAFWEAQRQREAETRRAEAEQRQRDREARERRKREEQEERREQAKQHAGKPWYGDSDLLDALRAMQDRIELFNDWEQTFIFDVSERYCEDDELSVYQQDVIERLKKKVQRADADPLI